MLPHLKLLSLLSGIIWLCLKPTSSPGYLKKRGKERMNEERNGRHKESDAGNVDKKVE